MGVRQPGRLDGGGRVVGRRLGLRGRGCAGVVRAAVGGRVSALGVVFVEGLLAERRRQLERAASRAELKQFSVSTQASTRVWGRTKYSKMSCMTTFISKAFFSFLAFSCRRRAAFILRSLLDDSDLSANSTLAPVKKQKQKK
jgi:hypothetical protein